MDAELDDVAQVVAYPLEMNEEITDDNNDNRFEYEEHSVATTSPKSRIEAPSNQLNNNPDRPWFQCSYPQPFPAKFHYISLLVDIPTRGLVP